MELQELKDEKQLVLERVEYLENERDLAESDDKINLIQRQIDCLNGYLVVINEHINLLDLEPENLEEDPDADPEPGDDDLE